MLEENKEGERMIRFKRPLFWVYAFFAIWMIFAVFAHFVLGPAPWILMLTFLLLIFWPGFSLSRLLRINFREGASDKIVLWLVLGITFSLAISSLAILFGMTLPVLMALYLIVLVLLFGIALFRDLKDLKTPGTVNFNLKEVFQSKNLIFFLLWVLIVLILISVVRAGANFKGDPLYHLAIMRKVIGGYPLTVTGLSYIKFSHELPYIFPIWHVFLGLLSKITNMSIFSFWAEIPASIAVLFLIVWYWLSKKIMPNKEIAAITLFIFIIYFWQVIFAFGQYGYMLARLPVPDTFAQLLLLPLSLGLALKYIFDKTAGYKTLLILSLLVIFMALVHFTQYFYFLFIMGFFAVGYSVLKFRDPEFKPVLRKILLAAFMNVLMLLPFLIAFEIKDHVFSKAISLYIHVVDIDFPRLYDSYDLYTQIAFIVLPILLIFTKKYAKIGFVLAILMLIPIVYFKPIEVIIGRFLSWVMIKRFYNNIAWPFMVWPLILGFLLILWDRLISKIDKTSKSIKYIIEGLLAISAIALVWLELKSGLVSSFYHETVVSEATRNWLIANHNWLIISLTVLVLMILYLFKNSKSLWEFFTFSETKNKLPHFLLFFIIIFFLISLSFKGLISNLNDEIKSSHFFSEPYDPSASLADPERIGGNDTINFIKNNIPAKSIFDGDHAYFLLPLLVDVHMSDYSSEANNSYGKVYDGDFPIEQRLACLNIGKIDYVFLLEPDKEETIPFDEYPQYFKKIFEETVTIYEVNKANITFARDIPVLTCRVQ